MRLRSTKRSSDRHYPRRVRLRGRRRNPKSLQTKLKALPQVPLALQHELDEGQTKDQELNATRAHGGMLGQANHLQTGPSTTYNE